MNCLKKPHRSLETFLASVACPFHPHSKTLFFSDFLNFPEFQVGSSFTLSLSPSCDKFVAIQLRNAYDCIGSCSVEQKPKQVFSPLLSLSLGAVLHSDLVSQVYAKLNLPIFSTHLKDKIFVFLPTFGVM